MDQILLIVAVAVGALIGGGVSAGLPPTKAESDDPTQPRTRGSWVFHLFASSVAGFTVAIGTKVVVIAVGWKALLDPSIEVAGLFCISVAGSIAGMHLVIGWDAFSARAEKPKFWQRAIPSRFDEPDDEKKDGKK